MRRRNGALLACCAALAAGACGDAEGVEVQPLPPLQRPSPEARAGLPEVRGVWRFAGFEIPADDTAAVRERVYALVPPGEFRIATQRLDSIAGQYVRDGAAFPLVGEIRRDSVLALVSLVGDAGQFVAGRVVRDTLWIELTSFSAAETWPRGTRAALVRRGAGQPFQRLVGGAPIALPVDSAALRDSLVMDSLRRAGVAVPPGAQPPAGQAVPGQPVPSQVQPPQARPPAQQPQARPPAQQPQARPPAPQPQARPPAQQPQARPPAQQPQARPPAQQPQRPPVQQPQRPPVRPPPVQEPEPRPVQEPQPVPPRPNAPRDTIRFGQPP